MSQQSPRSPVFTRRPSKFYEAEYDPSFQPIVLLTYDTNERLLLAHRKTLIQTNSTKRVFNSSPFELNLSKRRCQRFLFSKSLLIFIYSVNKY